MCENNDLNERLLECEKELANRKDDLDTWTDSLEELSEIEDAFATDGIINLDSKKILDIGTDCVKPLYIALKNYNALYKRNSNEQNRQGTRVREKGDVDTK